MVEEVAGRNALKEETLAAVVERTGGVPLFVEELTRAVLEGGESKSSGVEIPVTLHDSLMARIDRQGRAKEIIQIGAVIGSEVSYELLHAVHRIGATDSNARCGPWRTRNVIRARHCAESNLPVQQHSSETLLTTHCSRAGAKSCIAWWRAL